VSRSVRRRTIPAEAESRGDWPTLIRGESATSTMHIV